MLAMMAMFLDGMGDVANSPFIVPVAGCVMIVGIIGFQAWSGVKRREMQSQERLAAIAKGLTPPPTLEELTAVNGKPTPDIKRRYANVRLAGIILVCGGVGLSLFFLILGAVLQVRPLFGVAGTGLIPLGIGVGLLIDAGLQKQEIERSTAQGAAEKSLAL